MLKSISLLLAATVASVSGLRCLDNSGYGVDWWFTYKYPDGFNNSYFDPTLTATPMLQQFSKNLDDQSSPVALVRTLQSLLGGSASYLMYNDQPPNGKSYDSYGHTKGVLGISDNGAFWITHSTPEYPQVSSNPQFWFPESETKFGMTLDNSDIDKIAGQFLYNKPYVYFSNIPSSTLSNYPNLQKVLNKEWNTDANGNAVTFNVGGEIFTSFAKNSEWDKDLYEDLVAPTLSINMQVESWIRGEALGPYCPPSYNWQILDVQNIAVKSLNGGNITWKETQDHAKWGIPTSNTPQVCICDINRMTSQRNRGGGCACLKHKGLFRMLAASISNTNSC